MSQELAEAMQVARVTIDGVPVVIKGAYQAIQDLIKFIKLLYKKTPSGKEKEKIKEFLSQPGERQYLTMKDEDLSAFKKSLDKANIAYIDIPDFNTKDGKSSIMFLAQDFNVIKGMAEKIEYEHYKTFEEYQKVYGENWTKDMEDLFKEQANLPTVELAYIVNEKNNLSLEEIKAELKKSGKYSDEQINLAIEDAIKDNLIKLDEKGNYNSIENFNKTLTEHYEKNALMRGRALREDKRFENANIDERMRLSDEEISKWELPENDLESGLVLSYYKLPNTEGKQVVGIPKEHICGTLYPGTKYQSNEVFLGKANRYKIYDISDKKLKRLEDKRGSQLKEEAFSRKVTEGSGIKEKDKNQERTQNKNKSKDER